MAAPESVHKVQSNSDDLPPQHHAGRVGYGPNYHPEPVAMFPESYQFVDTIFTDNSREDQGAERRTQRKGQTRSRVDQAWPRYS